MVALYADLATIKQNMGDQIKNYKEATRQARIKVIEMIFRAQSSHVGSNLSAIDMLTVLFEKLDFENDRLVAGKSWVAATLYYLLSEKGIIPKEDLERYCQPGEKVYMGVLEPHPIFGMEFACGSLGYSLPGAVGFALTKKLNGEKGNAYVLVTDGEMQVGMMWESILIAKQHNLANLVVFIDNNRLQAMGVTKDILNIEPLDERVKTFGWHVQRVDGHDYKAIESAIDNVSDSSPNMIICDTVKGKGVSFMENNNLYHYKHLSQEEFDKAMEELGGAQGAERESQSANQLANDL